MFDYDDDELDREDEELDEDEEIEDDEETLKELDVDENGHVCEGRRKKRRSRDDEYEDDDFERAMPEAYGYEESYD